jgi:hypothetical protein
VGVRPSSESDPARTPVHRLEFVEVRSTAVAAVAATASGATAGVAVAEAVSVKARRRVATATASATASARTVESELAGDTTAVVESHGEAEPPVIVRPSDPGWSLWSDAEL